MLRRRPLPCLQLSLVRRSDSCNRTRLRYHSPGSLHFLCPRVWCSGRYRRRYRRRGDTYHRHRRGLRRKLYVLPLLTVQPSQDAVYIYGGAAKQGQNCRYGPKPSCFKSLVLLAPVFHLMILTFSNIQREAYHQLTRARNSCVLVACITSSNRPDRPQTSLWGLSFRSQRAWQNKEDECRNTGCISNEDDTVMPCCLAPKTLCVLVN